MDDVVVPRTRNLRPRKPYVDPFAQPRRSVRRARARLSAADFYVLDNEEDGDWNGAADDEVGDDEVVELGVSSRRSQRSNRRVSGRRETHRSARSTPEPTTKKRSRKPKVLLPEDVPFREPYQPQPEADPEDAAHAPSVAFVAIFVATFPTLFEDLGRLPSPQDIEAGVLASEPSELVEFLFRRVLGCVLNRKKEIEVGRYNSALSELHAQRNTLGMGPWFPPLQWKSKGNAFAELKWYDRLELLHVLIHWSLSASDRVRQLLKQLDDEAVKPWIGSDDVGNHYYIVGFDPVAEGAEEHTPFRVYKESNRLLQTVKWEPVASSATEVQAFLDSHIKRSTEETAKASTNEDPEEKDAEAEKPNVENDNVEQGSEALKPENNGQVDENEGSGPEPVLEQKPVEYDLPKSVVDTLLYFLPAMYRSEAVTMDRLQKEAKRARRRNDIMWQAETISNGGGRYAGRTRGRKINYAELLRDTVEDDDDETPRKRRLRQRDVNYEWREPEPETRQQRHARIMAERAAERANWSSNDVSVEPTPDYTPSTLSQPGASEAPDRLEELSSVGEQNGEQTQNGTPAVQVDQLEHHESLGTAGAQAHPLSYEHSIQVHPHDEPATKPLDQLQSTAHDETVFAGPPTSVQTPVESQLVDTQVASVAHQPFSVTQTPSSQQTTSGTAHHSQPLTDFAGFPGYQAPHAKAWPEQDFTSQNEQSDEAQGVVNGPPLGFEHASSEIDNNKI